MSIKEAFSPIPYRALADPRFTASHFRVLGAIAFHDRFSIIKNGAGCYAGRQKLSDETGVHLTNVSHMVTDLVAWGYIKSGRHRMNGRQRTYQVIYQDQPIGGEQTTYQASAIGGEQTIYTSAIGGPTIHQSTDSNNQSDVEYIKRSFDEENIPLSGAAIGESNDQFPGGQRAGKPDLKNAFRGEPTESSQPVRLQLGELMDRIASLTGMVTPPPNRKTICKAIWALPSDLSEEAHLAATPDKRLLQILLESQSMAA